MTSIIRNLSQWIITSPNKELLEEIWIIDYHSHVWNILKRDPSQLYDVEKTFPIDIRTLGWNFWKFKAPWKIMEALMHTNFVDDILKKSWKNRNESATLKTFYESLEDSFTYKTVILPIPPYQTFDDLLEVQKHNDKMILFTWVDFKSLVNWVDIKIQESFDKLEIQFKNDINNWAKWLKIHPIIQWVSANSDIVNDVVTLWTDISKWLPIIFHTWVTEYCMRDEICNNHKPEYGEIKYFIDLAKNQTKANIVIGHSGLFQVDEVAEYLSKFDNVVVDTSFQWKEKINLLLNKFWENRLMYASDWPYWDRVPAINVMLDSLNWNRELITKIMRDNALYSMKMK